MLMYAKGFQWVGALCEVENYAQAAQAQAQAEDVTPQTQI